MMKPECRIPEEARRLMAGGVSVRGRGAAGALLVAGLLSSCGTTSNTSQSGMPPMVPSSDGPVTVGQLEAVKKLPDVKFKTVRVSMQVRQAKKAGITALPEVIARQGQPVKVEQLNEFLYPADFDFATVNPTSADPKKSGSYPMTPTTPRGFTSRNNGLTVAFTATSRGPFIMLKGTVTESTCERLVCNPGLVFSPVVTDDRRVVLTDNKCLSPQFTDRITHFHLAALPGQSLSLPLNSAEQGRRLEIEADLPGVKAISVTRPRGPQAIAAAGGDSLEARPL